MNKHLFLSFMVTLFVAFPLASMNQCNDPMDEEWDYEEYENVLRDKCFSATRLLEDFEIKRDNTLLVIERAADSFSAFVASKFVPQGNVIAIKIDLEKTKRPQKVYKNISNLQIYKIDDVTLIEGQKIDYVVSVGILEDSYKLQEIKDAVNKVTSHLKLQGRCLACVTTRYPPDYPSLFLRSVNGVKKLVSVSLEEIFDKLQEHVNEPHNFGLSSNIALLQFCSSKIG